MSPERKRDALFAVGAASLAGVFFLLDPGVDTTFNGRLMQYAGPTFAAIAALFAFSAAFGPFKLGAESNDKADPAS